MYAELDDPRVGFHLKLFSKPALFLPYLFHPSTVRLSMTTLCKHYLLET